MNQTIKITQWNVLARSLCTQESFPLVNKDHLDWNYRASLIKTLMPQSDIYCFEEVDEPDFFISLFPGYNCHFYKKPNNSDGIFVAYKPELLLKSQEYIPYTKDVQPQNQGFVKLEFDNFYVLVTHLKAKPQFEDVRAEQLEQLSKHVSAIKIIVVGDFNTQPDLKAVKGFINDTKLISANVDTPTTCKNRGKLEISIKHYIFYSGCTLVEFSIPKIVFPDTGLPSVDFPSDHLFLTAEFQI